MAGPQLVMESARKPHKQSSRRSLTRANGKSNTVHKNNT
jgi:hypothetical protein